MTPSARAVDLGLATSGPEQDSGESGAGGTLGQPAAQSYTLAREAVHGRADIDFDYGMLDDVHV